MKKAIYGKSDTGKQGGSLLLPVMIVTLLLSSSDLFAQAPDTLKGPVVNIRVNKETDDQGNVIRYDSTYTWYWSSGDTLSADDSTFFRRFFSLPGGWHYGPGLLVPDSLPGIIFSPFEEGNDPFFFGFPDTSALRRMEQMFRDFMEPSHTWPDEDFFRRFGIPVPKDLFPPDTLSPPGKSRPAPKKTKGKVIIL